MNVGSKSCQHLFSISSLIEGVSYYSLSIFEWMNLTVIAGGRTAWSATVTVGSQNIAARYWYDGQYLNNAKEDAAEVACTKLRNPPGKDSDGRISAKL